MTRPEIRSPLAFGRTYGLDVLVSNWCPDLDLALQEAGHRDPVYHEHRLRYSREILTVFPDEHPSEVIHFIRAEGESLWHLGRKAEAEAVFVGLVERFPDEGMAYLGWSQLYWLEDESQQEFARAEGILQRALARPQLRDRDELQDQLEDLRAERAKAGRRVSPRTRLSVPSAPLVPALAAGAPAPRRRPGRNEPCWCGSGKKYKRCHLGRD
jgi:hypothetical protein